MDNLCEFNEEQLKKALTRAVNDILQKNIFPVPKPTAFLLGGQSGAGKSTIHQILLSQSPNFIVIDGDRYRAYHPNFAEIQEKYGENAANYTQKFVNSIINSLMKKFSSEHYNLIVEGTCRTAEVPPRAVPRDKFEETVRAIPDNISALYKSGEFDNILLFNRKTECLYNMKKQPQLNPAEIVKRELAASRAPEQAKPAPKPKHRR